MKRDLPDLWGNGWLDGHYVKSYYNTEASEAYYSKIKGLLPKEKIAFKSLPQHSRVLDLGCGAGRTTAVFHDNGHDVIGCDISAALVKAAKNRIPKTPFAVGNACFLSFKDDHFHVVVFSNSGIDYIYPYAERLRALQEIKRVLRPGGLFIFSSHNNCIPRNRDGVIPFLKSLFKKKRNTYISDTAYSWGTAIIYLTTPALQIEELERAGFEPVKLIPRRLLRKVKSLSLLGLLDSYVYYVVKIPS